MRVRVVLSLVVAAALTTPQAASAAFAHTVAPGESLYSIAAADGLSVGQLAAANGLSPSAPLIAGTAVQIPPQTGGSSQLATTSAAAPVTAGDGDRDCDDVGDGDCDSDDGFASTSPAPASTMAAPASSGSYVVQPGDTLSAIAARAGLSVVSLAAANGLSPDGILPSGTALRLSGTPASRITLPTTSASPAYSQPVGVSAQGSAVGPPYPTAQTVSAQQIGQVAAANGVSPSLAQAIAWQESGFNNAAVSGADARGVMQILPGTWNYIQHTLIPGAPPLAPASALDNVRGGVVLLRSLLNATGGNPALAAAGYYQGLPSVEKHGMFPSTQRYVNSVMALRARFGGG
jgi:LysM repeat protein